MKFKTWTTIHLSMLSRKYFFRGYKKNLIFLFYFYLKSAFGKKVICSQFIIGKFSQGYTNHRFNLIYSDIHTGPKLCPISFHTHVKYKEATKQIGTVSLTRQKRGTYFL